MKRNQAEFRPTSGLQPNVSARALRRVGEMVNEALQSQLDLVRLMNQGVQPAAIDELVKRGLDLVELQWVIAPRTLRHRRQRHERLKTDETERWLRAATLHALATEVLGDQDKAIAWLHQPRRAFDGKSAVELMQTEPGAELVEELLLQLDSGYFA